MGRPNENRLKINTILAKITLGRGLFIIDIDSRYFSTFFKSVVDAFECTFIYIKLDLRGDKDIEIIK